MANAPTKNFVQLGIGGWQVPRPGIKVCRERATNILTVTDIMDMGMDAVVDFAVERATDGTDCMWLSLTLTVLMLDLPLVQAGLNWVGCCPARRFIY